LKNVLRVSFAASYPGSTTASFGLSSGTGAQLLSQLHSYPGVTVLPLYVAPGQSAVLQVPKHRPNGPPPSQQRQADSGITCGADGCSAADLIVNCQSLRQFSVLGACGAGTTTVRADLGQVMIGDNLLGLNLPIVGDSTTTAADQAASLTLGGVLVKTNDSATLERVRTLLTEYTARAGTADPPETFGEVAQARSAQYEEIQQIALVVVWLTILVAGCSLAIAVCAGVVERRRPFTLIRLTGTPTRALYGVVLLESLVPLLTASIVAAGVGLAVAVPIVKQFASKSTSIAFPGSSYFLSMGAGVIVSLLIILAALPLLNRVTNPNDARFE
ncbi:MAG: FtsX-like permease family protein, partial [Trebonia sp.]